MSVYPATQVLAGEEEGTMDLTWSPEEDAFRTEVRAWLEEHAPADTGDGSDDELYADEDDAFEVRRAWQRKLGEAGYLAMHWPTEYGGGGASLVEQVIFNEEYARAGAPQPVNGLGLNLVGPTLLVHGTDAQKQRFLKNILTADEIWCQGYSEPNAGSDLAGLQTRAEIVGDEFVINGQKIWTTLGKWGDWIFVLCRTDPDAPKHQGISYILCPMDQPGIEVRPIKQMTGGSGFAEVFFTDARTPTDMLVGSLNDGWRVAMTTLMFERGGNVLGTSVTYRTMMTQLEELARKVERNGGSAIDDPAIRQRLGRLLGEVAIMRWNGLRTISPRLKGEPPGPESSLSKLYWSEWYRRATDLAMEILGPLALGIDPAQAGAWATNYLASRAATIYTGTSEIQRNIIAERVLGLPRVREAVPSGNVDGRRTVGAASSGTGKVS
jgi:alkylation response protein AidB-like acyl-CoA dehydrogenase